MTDFATLEDVERMFRPMKDTAEESKCEALLPVVSAAIRMEADNAGKDIETMLENIPGYGDILKAVVVDVVARALNTSTDAEPMSQYTESALGYSFSGTYAVPGGGSIQIMKNDLRRLGIRRQRLGVIDLCSKE